MTPQHSCPRIKGYCASYFSEKHFTGLVPLPRAVIRAADCGSFHLEQNFIVLGSRFLDIDELHAGGRGPSS